MKNEGAAHFFISIRSAISFLTSTTCHLPGNFLLPTVMKVKLGLRSALELCLKPQAENVQTNKLDSRA